MARGRLHPHSVLVARRTPAAPAGVRARAHWALVQPWALVGETHPGRVSPAGARIFRDEACHAAAIDAWVAALPDPPPAQYAIPDGPAYWAPVSPEIAALVRAGGEAQVDAVPPRPPDATQRRRVSTVSG